MLSMARATGFEPVFFSVKGRRGSRLLQARMKWRDALGFHQHLRLFPGRLKSASCREPMQPRGSAVVLPPPVAALSRIVAKSR